jgi:hypothetical protein
VAAKEFQMAFDWLTSLTPAREHILRLRIEQVRDDGATGALQPTFSPAGLPLFAADLASAESTS